MQSANNAKDAKVLKTKKLFSRSLRYSRTKAFNLFFRLFAEKILQKKPVHSTG